MAYTFVSEDADEEYLRIEPYGTKNGIKYSVELGVRISDGTLKEVDTRYWETYFDTLAEAWEFAGKFIKGKE